MNIVPSMPQAYDRTPRIIGYTFTRKDGLFYADNGGVTMFKDRAYVYSFRTILAVSRVGGWGNKRQGKWRAVYAY